jgi:hypothetical protein
MDWFMRKSVGKPWFLPAIIVVSCKPSFIYFWDMDGVSFRCRVLLGNPHGETSRGYVSRDQINKSSYWLGRKHQIDRTAFQDLKIFTEGFS